MTIQSGTVTFTGSDPLFPLETGIPSVVLTWPQPWHGDYAIVTDPPGFTVYSHNATGVRLRAPTGYEGVVRVMGISYPENEAPPFAMSEDWSAGSGSFSYSGQNHGGYDGVHYELREGDVVVPGWFGYRDRYSNTTGSIGFGTDAGLKFVRVRSDGGFGGSTINLRHLEHLTANAPTTTVVATWRARITGSVASTTFGMGIVGSDDFSAGAFAYFKTDAVAGTNYWDAYAKGNTGNVNNSTTATGLNLWRDYAIRIYGPATPIGVAAGNKFVARFSIDGVQVYEFTRTTDIVGGEVRLWFGISCNNYAGPAIAPTLDIAEGITLSVTPWTTEEMQITTGVFDGTQPEGDGRPHVLMTWPIQYKAANRYRVLYGIQTAEELELNVQFGGKAADSISVSLNEQCNATFTCVAIPVNPVLTPVNRTVLPPEPTSAPVVTSVSPEVGPLGGGTAITISGAGFDSACTATWGGSPLTITHVNSTTLTATAPAHAAGSVSVVIMNPDAQTGTGSNVFTYAVAPTYGSVSPLGGGAGGGTAVTITGTGFISGCTLTWAGSSLACVFVNSTTITAITPAHATGAVSFTVTNPDTQAVTATNAFTYAAAPAYTSIAPNRGTTSGGTPITITGSGFVSGCTLTWAGSSLAVTFVNSTTLTATAPVHAAGAVSLVVTNPDAQTATGTNAYTYIANGLVMTPDFTTNSRDTATARTMVMTKPANLAVGDMLVMTSLVGLGSSNPQFVWTKPDSGWTHVAGSNAADGTASPDIWWKVATSTETAATTFTWTVPSGYEYAYAAILHRITGQASTFIEYAYNNSGWVNSTTYTAPDYGGATVPWGMFRTYSGIGKGATSGFSGAQADTGAYVNAAISIHTTFETFAASSGATGTRTATAANTGKGLASNFVIKGA